MADLTLPQTKYQGSTGGQEKEAKSGRRPALFFLQGQLRRHLAAYSSPQILQLASQTTEDHLRPSAQRSEHETVNPGSSRWRDELRRSTKPALKLHMPRSCQVRFFFSVQNFHIPAELMQGRSGPGCSPWQFGGWMRPATDRKSSRFFFQL